MRYCAIRAATSLALFVALAVPGVGVDEVPDWPKEVKPGGAEAVAVPVAKSPVSGLTGSVEKPGVIAPVEPSLVDAGAGEGGAEATVLGADGETGSVLNAPTGEVGAVAGFDSGRAAPGGAEEKDVPVAVLLKKLGGADCAMAGGRLVAVASLAATVPVAATLVASVGAAFAA